MTGGVRACLVFAGLAAMVVVAAGELRKPLTDKDIERLAEQWADEPDEDDPVVQMQKRMEARQQAPMPGFDPNNFDPSKMAAQSMKGQTKMMFADVSGGGRTREENEQRGGFWVSQLQNAHVHVKMYMVEADNILFVTERGEEAMQIIDFLTDQPEVTEVTLDSKKHPNKKAAKKKAAANQGKGRGRRRKSRRRRRRKRRDATAPKEEL